MPEPQEIVEKLLDLVEDLGAKLPVLLKQFPEYSEAEIRAMAEADPSEKANYLTWLLRLRRQGVWDGSEQPARDALTRFEEIKRGRFGGFNGKRDINQYKSLDELQQTLADNPTAGTRKERAQKGAKALKKEGDLALFQMLTPETASKFCIGRGTPGDTSTYDARWCTSAIETAQNYMENQGELYVVLKAGQPYVQVEFDEKQRQTNPQAKDAANQEINYSVATEIAPLFDDPMFDKIWAKYKPQRTGWTVRDEHIERKISQLISRWYKEKLKGHMHSEKGTWIAPSAATLAEVRASLTENMPQFFQLFATCLSDPSAKDNEPVVRQLGEHTGSPAGVQALFNAVYDRRHPDETESALPPLLQNLETFMAKFNELANQHEKQAYPQQTR
jgi:hypothetical protein